MRHLRQTGEERGRDLLTTIYRVQDKQGRGPWKPGESLKWKDEGAVPPSWMSEFGVEILKQIQNGEHFACGCTSVAQLRKWFSEREYKTLLSLGYQAVEMKVDFIIAESDNQCAFTRRRRLDRDYKSIDLYD